MCSVCLQLIHFCSFSFGWRQQTFAIERDFSAGTSFCGSTNILKISLGIPFRANSYLLFNLHGRLSKNNKLTEVFILESFISTYFKRVLKWHLSARLTPFMGLIYARHTLQNFKESVYVYICNSFDRQFVQPVNLKRVGCIEGVLSVDDIKNYKI